MSGGSPNREHEHEHHHGIAKAKAVLVPLGTMAEKSHEWNAVHEKDPKLGGGEDVERGVPGPDNRKLN